MFERKNFLIKSDLGKVLRLSIMAAIIFGFMALVSMTAQAESNPNPKVLPVNSVPYGKTYGEWSAEWWEWALSIPTPDNPLLDMNGEKCGVEQSGDVWFLAGNFGGASERTCTVPAGKAIFFPIINAEWSVVEGECPLDIDISGTNEEALRACAVAFMDHVTELEVSVDGTTLQNLENYRVQSPLFTFELPEDNILGLSAGPSPSVSDGFWIMLAPLSAGEHTIHFRGEADFPFVTKVTYTLTVE